MLELFIDLATVRWLGYLYWLLSIVVLAFVIYKGKSLWVRIIGSLIVIGVFGTLPVIALVEQHRRDTFSKEAWAYFKKLCDEKSGEKIYETFTGVKSVVVLKPLPPAKEKDSYDQYWYGDPYSAAATSGRSFYAATRLTMNRKHRSGSGIQRGLDFVEIKNESGEDYIRIHRSRSYSEYAKKERVDRPVSKFGASWEDISTPEDRKHWVAASRFRTIDLTDNSVIAERIGFLIEPGFGSTAGGRRPWLTARGVGPNGNSCPDAHDATDLWFITSVFRQLEE